MQTNACKNCGTSVEQLRAIDESSDDREAASVTYGDGGGAPYVESRTPTHAIKVQGWDGRDAYVANIAVAQRPTGDPHILLLADADGKLTPWSLIRGELYFEGEACDRSLGAFQRRYGRPQSGRKGHYAGATARCVPVGSDGVEL